MGDAGIAELHICAGNPLPFRVGRAVQVDDGGVVELYFILLLRDAAGSNRAGRRPEADVLRVRRKAVLHPIAGQAARAVAAHLALCAVGIVEEHAEIRPLCRGDGDHPIGVKRGA